VRIKICKLQGENVKISEYSNSIAIYICSLNVWSENEVESMEE